MTAKKLILFTSPLILFSEFMLLSWITNLLRQPSDISVVLGVFAICIGIAINFYLGKFIYKHLKN